MNVELINYRRKKAKEIFKDAKITFNKVSLFTTVNRIYSDGEGISQNIGRVGDFFRN